jgi:NAD(P)-dependent dehydrogenase (short-subunit alcohol dehydrogenase family)
MMLTGRTAIVTGAARGIGRAIALTYARFGAQLAVCDREEDDLRSLEAELPGCTAALLDVRDDDAVRAFCTSLDRVDVLVNNAGGTFMTPFLDVSPKGEDALVRENFTSAVSFIHHAVPLMTGGGSIINVTSIEAHRACPGAAIYAAMKAALANLTMTLALELGDRMIRVNCIAPDVIPTPGVGEMGEPRTPLPRKGHVDDVAGAAVWLASDLSSFVTGTTVHVDGGNAAAGGWSRAADGRWLTGFE